MTFLRRRLPTSGNSFTVTCTGVFLVMTGLGRCGTPALAPFGFRPARARFPPRGRSRRIGSSCCSHAASALLPCRPLVIRLALIQD
ncbi:MAG TPA: hypothetical protein VFU21_22325 [Kofleriaceae bacterium]|nr:hypothetical protein [Kofleriaceae bacterium]